MTDEINEASEAAVLAKLVRYLKTHEKIPDGDFTSDQMIALKRVADREIGRIYIGKLAAASKGFFMYVGFFIGVYLAVKGGAEDWVRSLFK